MYKYIQDTIRNNSRSIIAGMTKPQKKSFAELVRGLFVENTPVLRHLAQDKTKTAKSLGITIKTLYNKLHRYGVFDSGQPGDGEASVSDTHDQATGS